MKWVFGIASVFVLVTIYSTAFPTSPAAPLPTGLPVSQAGGGGHTPVILNVVERKVNDGGRWTVNEDITFTDAAGDATTVVDKLVYTSQPGTASNLDILASLAEQIRGATITDTWKCGTNPELAVETRILDRAGNLSEPRLITITCPAAQSLNTTGYTIAGLVIGLLLVAGAGLALRFRLFERISLLRPGLMLLLLLFPLNFLFLILHEGGHSLASLVSGGTISQFYVHPFSFSGYSLPLSDWNNPWIHAAGAMLLLPASLGIALLFWRQRSARNLALVMLFPWAWLMQGISTLQAAGDWANIIELTGLPAILFNVIGVLLFAIGAFFFVALLPRIGLDPQNKKSLLVLPAVMLLWSLVGMSVAFLVVPGSSIDIQYGRAGEILTVVYLYPVLGIVIGLILGLVFITLYRRIFQRLPGWLRAEPVQLTWKDFLRPGLVSAICILLGITAIA